MAQSFQIGDFRVDPDLNRIEDLRPEGESTQVEPKVMDVLVCLHAARGEVDVHGELKIRRALGNLKSSLFMLQVGKDSRGHFRLAGGGHGHGVGMCQHGAMGMAKAGKSHAKILAHYYRGSQLLTLW